MFLVAIYKIHALLKWYLLQLFVCKLFKLMFEGFLFPMANVSSHQRFPIGLKSGLIAGHFKTGMCDQCTPDGKQDASPLMLQGVVGTSVALLCFLSVNFMKLLYCHVFFTKFHVLFCRLYSWNFYLCIYFFTNSLLKKKKKKSPCISCYVANLLSYSY